MVIKETKIVEYYRSEAGKSPFKDWLLSLDYTIQSRIESRLTRLSFGNYGDYKSLKGGVYELKFQFGAGYRVYFAEDGDEIVILLCGGDKGSQNKDIKKAQEYLQIYLERKNG